MVLIFIFIVFMAIAIMILVKGHDIVLMKSPFRLQITGQQGSRHPHVVDAGVGGKLRKELRCRFITLLFQGSQALIIGGNQGRGSLFQGPGQGCVGGQTPDFPEDIVHLANLQVCH